MAFLSRVTLRSVDTNVEIAKAVRHPVEILIGVAIIRLSKADKSCPYYTHSYAAPFLFLSIHILLFRLIFVFVLVLECEI